MAYTPLAEVPRELEDGQGLAWQVEPSAYLDQDRLAVHTGRLLRYARVVGFGGLIVRQYVGEQSECSTTNSSVTDVNFDGSATGFMASALAKVERERFSVEDEGTALGTEYLWPVGILDINRNELASRAADRAQTGQPREMAWAREVDDSLRRGLARLAFQKFKTDAVGKGLIDSMYTALYASFITANIIQQSPVALAATVATAHAVTTLWGTLCNTQERGEHLLDRKRWSFFPVGVQPDRVALAMIMSGSSKFVTYSD